MVPLLFLLLMMVMLDDVVVVAIAVVAVVVVAPVGRLPDLAGNDLAEGDVRDEILAREHAPRQRRRVVRSQPRLDGRPFIRLPIGCGDGVGERLEGDDSLEQILV